MLLVLIHGIAASRRFFEGLEPELGAATGARTLSFDLLGFGKNKLRGKEYTLREHLDFIKSEIDLVRKEGEEVVLIGHSMGGILALSFAHENRGMVSKIILLNTPIAESPENLEKSFRREKQGWAYFLIAHRRFSRIACEVLCQMKGMRLLKHWKRPYMSDEVFEDYTEHTFKSVDRTFRSVVLGVHSAQLIRELDGIPILHVMGTRDIETVRNSPAFANVIRREITGGHHLPLQNPHAVAGAIAEFLTGAPA